MVPTPNINISSNGGNSFGQNHHLGTSISNSPFNPTTLAAAAALRRPSLVLSAGSFHSAQLRRASFFAPFPYSQSPQQAESNVIHDYSSSPRRDNVYQRDLEANYCTNFSCCGLTLGDLHALLQHYEEAHVRFEEDDDSHPVPAGFTEDDGWSTGSEDSSMGRNPFRTQINNTTSGSNLSSVANASAAATVAALTAQHQQKHTPLSFLNARKKSTSVSLSDIYSVDSGFTPDDAISAFPNSILRTAAQAKEASLANKKRDLATFSTSYDTHSPLAKKVSHLPTPPSQSKAGQTAAAILGGMNKNQESGTVFPSRTTQQQDELLNTVTGYLEHAIQQGMLPNCGEVGSPQFLLAAEDLIRKREEIVSMMETIGRSSTSNADKPYRCTVSGCDKAYKNPNGLKYHNQHGHCAQPGVSEDEKLNARPYRCTFLDCGKCYKNLNGLKYHIEHSHPNLAAALHAHIPGFATLDGANVSQAAIAAAAAIAAVQANPMMMAAANAIMASSTNTVNRSSTSLSDHTPDSSPTPSPTLAQVQPTLASNLSAYRGNDNTFSTDVTPMTSPVLSRATLPGLNLSIQTALHNQNKVSGLLTPSALSPTASAPKSSSVGVSQVSTLTAALAAVTAFDHPDAPVVRVTGADIPTPYAANLESFAFPDTEVIARVVQRTLNKKIGAK
ncbi:Transcriptional regulator of ribosomal biogenesis proteins [Mortierella antarctica]|nr:Transcriptional regulator of ribosomal biogenesis proteins [Mortierella antarctica]